MINSNLVERPHRVTAVFADSRLHFHIARDATLAELAEQIYLLGKGHGGMPRLVEVAVPVEKSGTRHLS
jgi:hypothetical protein